MTSDYGSVCNSRMSAYVNKLKFWARKYNLLRVTTGDSEVWMKLTGTNFSLHYLAEKLQQKENNHLIELMIEDLVDWLNNLLILDTSLTKLNFFNSLKNGVIVCKLANFIQEYVAQQSLSTSATNSNNIPKGYFIRYDRERQDTSYNVYHFWSQTNLCKFFNWCAAHNIPKMVLFNTNDLAEHSNKVVTCLMDLSRYFHLSYNIPTPMLIQLEKLPRSYLDCIIHHQEGGKDVGEPGNLTYADNQVDYCFFEGLNITQFITLSPKKPYESSPQHTVKLGENPESLTLNLASKDENLQDINKSNSSSSHLHDESQESIQLELDNKAGDAQVNVNFNPEKTARLDNITSYIKPRYESCVEVSEDTYKNELKYSNRPSDDVLTAKTFDIVNARNITKNDPFRHNDKTPFEYYLAGMPISDYFCKTTESEELLESSIIKDKKVDIHVCTYPLGARRKSQTRCREVHSLEEPGASSNQSVLTDKPHAYSHVEDVDRIITTNISDEKLVQGVTNVTEEKHIESSTSLIRKKSQTIENTKISESSSQHFLEPFVEKSSSVVVRSNVSHTEEDSSLFEKKLQTTTKIEPLKITKEIPSGEFKESVLCLSPSETSPRSDITSLRQASVDNIAESVSNQTTDADTTNATTSNIVRVQHSSSNSSQISSTYSSSTQKNDKITGNINRFHADRHQHNELSVERLTTADSIIGNSTLVSADFERKNVSIDDTASQYTTICDEKNSALIDKQEPLPETSEPPKDSNDSQSFSHIYRNMLLCPVCAMKIIGSNLKDLLDDSVNSKSDERLNFALNKTYEFDNELNTDWIKLSKNVNIDSTDIEQGSFEKMDNTNREKLVNIQEKTTSHSNRSSVKTIITHETTSRSISVSKEHSTKETRSISYIHKIGNNFEDSSTNKSIRHIGSHHIGGTLDNSQEIFSRMTHSEVGTEPLSSTINQVDINEKDFVKFEKNTGSELDVVDPEHITSSFSEKVTENFEKSQNVYAYIRKSGNTNGNDSIGIDNISTNVGTSVDTTEYMENPLPPVMTNENPGDYLKTSKIYEFPTAEIPTRKLSTSVDPLHSSNMVNEESKVLLTVEINDKPEVTSNSTIEKEKYVDINTNHKTLIHQSDIDSLNKEARFSVDCSSIQVFNNKPSKSDFASIGSQGENELILETQNLENSTTDEIEKEIKSVTDKKKQVEESVVCNTTETQSACKSDDSEIYYSTGSLTKIIKTSLSSEFIETNEDEQLSYATTLSIKDDLNRKGNFIDANEGKMTENLNKRVQYIDDSCPVYKELVDQNSSFVELSTKEVDSSDAQWHPLSHEDKKGFNVLNLSDDTSLEKRELRGNDVTREEMNLSLHSEMGSQLKEKYFTTQIQTCESSILDPTSLKMIECKEQCVDISNCDNENNFERKRVLLIEKKAVEETVVLNPLETVISSIEASKQLRSHDSVHAIETAVSSSPHHELSQENEKFAVVTNLDTETRFEEKKVLTIKKEAADEMISSYLPETGLPCVESLQSERYPSFEIHIAKTAISDIEALNNASERESLDFPSEDTDASFVEEIKLPGDKNTIIEEMVLLSPPKTAISSNDALKQPNSHVRVHTTSIAASSSPPLDLDQKREKFSNVANLDNETGFEEKRELIVKEEALDEVILSYHPEISLLCVESIQHDEYPSTEIHMAEPTISVPEALSITQKGGKCHDVSHVDINSSFVETIKLSDKKNETVEEIVLLDSPKITISSKESLQQLKPPAEVHTTEAAVSSAPPLDLARENVVYTDISKLDNETGFEEKRELVFEEEAVDKIILSYRPEFGLPCVENLPYDIHCSPEIHIAEPSISDSTSHGSLLERGESSGITDLDIKASFKDNNDLVVGDTLVEKIDLPGPFENILGSKGIMQQEDVSTSEISITKPSVSNDPLSCLTNDIKDEKTTSPKIFENDNRYAKGMKSTTEADKNISEKLELKVFPNETSTNLHFKDKKLGEIDPTSDISNFESIPLNSPKVGRIADVEKPSYGSIIENDADYNEKGGIICDKDETVINDVKEIKFILKPGLVFVENENQRDPCTDNTDYTTRISGRFLHNPQNEKNMFDDNKNIENDVLNVSELSDVRDKNEAEDVGDPIFSVVRNISENEEISIANIITEKFIIQMNPNVESTIEDEQRYSETLPFEADNKENYNVKTETDVTLSEYEIDDIPLDNEENSGDYRESSLRTPNDKPAPFFFSPPSIIYEHKTLPYEPQLPINRDSKVRSPQSDEDIGNLTSYVRDRTSQNKLEKTEPKTDKKTKQTDFSKSSKNDMSFIDDRDPDIFLSENDINVALYEENLGVLEVSQLKDIEPDGNDDMARNITLKQYVEREFEKNKEKCFTYDDREHFAKTYTELIIQSFRKNKKLSKEAPKKANITSQNDPSDEFVFLAEENYENINLSESISKKRRILERIFGDDQMLINKYLPIVPDMLTLDKIKEIIEEGSKDLLSQSIYSLHDDKLDEHTKTKSISFTKQPRNESDKQFEEKVDKTTLEEFYQYDDDVFKSDDGDSNDDTASKWKGHEHLLIDERCVIQKDDLHNNKGGKLQYTYQNVIPVESRDPNESSSNSDFELNKSVEQIEVVNIEPLKNETSGFKVRINVISSHNYNDKEEMQHDAIPLELSTTLSDTSFYEKMIDYDSFIESKSKLPISPKVCEELSVQSKIFDKDELDLKKNIQYQTLSVAEEATLLQDHVSKYSEISESIKNDSMDVSNLTIERMDSSKILPYSSHCETHLKSLPIQSTEKSDKIVGISIDELDSIKEKETVENSEISKLQDVEDNNVTIIQESISIKRQSLTGELKILIDEVADMAMIPGSVTLENANLHRENITKRIEDAVNIRSNDSDFMEGLKELAELRAEDPLNSTAEVFQAVEEGLDHIIGNIGSSDQITTLSSEDSSIENRANIEDSLLAIASSTPIKRLNRADDSQKLDKCTKRLQFDDANSDFDQGKSVDKGVSYVSEENVDFVASTSTDKTLSKLTSSGMLVESSVQKVKEMESSDVDRIHIPGDIIKSFDGTKFSDTISGYDNQTQSDDAAGVYCEVFYNKNDLDDQEDDSSDLIEMNLLGKYMLQSAPGTEGPALVSPHKTQCIFMDDIWQEAQRIRITKSNTEKEMSFHSINYVNRSIESLNEECIYGYNKLLINHFFDNKNLYFMHTRMYRSGIENECVIENSPPFLMLVHRENGGLDNNDYVSYIPNTITDYDSICSSISILSYLSFIINCFNVNYLNIPKVFNKSDNILDKAFYPQLSQASLNLLGGDRVISYESLLSNIFSEPQASSNSNSFSVIHFEPTADEATLSNIQAVKNNNSSLLLNTNKTHRANKRDSLKPIEHTLITERKDSFKNTVAKVNSHRNVDSSLNWNSGGRLSRNLPLKAQTTYNRNKKTIGCRAPIQKSNKIPSYNTRSLSHPYSRYTNDKPKTRIAFGDRFSSSGYIKSKKSQTKQRKRLEIRKSLCLRRDRRCTLFREGLVKFGKRSIFIRNFENTFMVRVGGGWQPLDQFLEKQRKYRNTEEIEKKLQKILKSNITEHND